MKACHKHIVFFALLISANVFAQDPAEQWGRYEVVMNYDCKGNGFTDVTLGAVFSNDDTSIRVTGFYDGGTTYRIRFMPSKPGNWNYVTSSNIKSLNNKKGSFQCINPGENNHGPVQVSNVYSFSYADGRIYYPVGTTAYAWNHMDDGLQKMTLESLSKSGFDKVRMCVFPKNYDLVVEEPPLYPFEFNKNKDAGKWDLTKFNPAFFTKLEKQIDELNELGIQADLILFHPYDKGRWGFDALPMEVNLQYIRYITARLSSFRNVWWSLANEWDLIKSKTHDDWITFAKEVKKDDPYHHLLSIHGSTAKYIEYWMPEFTHASVQDEGPVMNYGAATILRNAYHKPVIYDEVGYEGNLTQRWGRYSGEEMTYLMWMGIIGGTYVTHGETYMYYGVRDTIFWAKGGYFRGESWKRAAFLRKVLESDPAPLEPADISRDLRTATTGKGVYIIYFGKEMNDSWEFNLPVKNASFEKPHAGEKFKAEIIDTWNMTITPCNEVFTLGQSEDYRFYDVNRKKIRLPLKPYIALRITEIK
jgi:hypothetical protein